MNVGEDYTANKILVTFFQRLIKFSFGVKKKKETTQLIIIMKYLSANVKPKNHIINYALGNKNKNKKIH